MNLLHKPTRHSVRVLALPAIIVVASFSPLAAREVERYLPTEIPETIVLTQQPMGVLTVISGNVTVNGNPGQTGMTILSSSTISTDSDGDAVIDLGLLGRVELYELTIILLTLTPVQVYVKSKCSKTSIRVIQGQVDVKSPKSETLLDGDEETYGGSVECVSNGGTDFIVDCSGRRRVIVPARRLLSLLGGGAGILGSVAPLPSQVQP